MNVCTATLLFCLPLFYCIYCMSRSEEKTTQHTFFKATSHDRVNPTCLKEDKGCTINPTNLIQQPLKINSWEVCQASCQSDSNCNYFVWYGPKASPFTYTCFLLKKLCESETTCSGCIS